MQDAACGRSPNSSMKKAREIIDFTSFSHFFSWASRIRTGGMQESKSCALPLGDGPIICRGTAGGDPFLLSPYRKKSRKPRASDLMMIKGGYRDSNPGPPEPQSGALTNCAIPTIAGYLHIRNEPEGIRTPDPRLRRPLLYPTELQTHNTEFSV